MSNQGYQFECKKDAWSQLQNGNYKITLTLHPDEIDDRFIRDEMGRRYMCVMVPIDDNEEPALAPAKVENDEVPRPDSSPQSRDKGKNYTAAAKLLAQNRAFWEYVDAESTEAAETYIEAMCGVQSCAEIKDGTEAGKKYAALYARFRDWVERFAQ